MADVTPFICHRPLAEVAAEYAALPYDVYNRAEAAEEIAQRPLSFLRIDKSAALVSSDIDEYDQCVYTCAKELFVADEQAGVILCDADKPHYYLYQLEKEGHVQTGIVACVAVDDYNNNVIKRHEKTREIKRKDRVDHIRRVGAHTGPILMTYRSQGAIDAAVAEEITAKPLYDFMASDGVCHRVWRIDDENATKTIQQAFSTIDALYIADGHHRAAAAALVHEEQQGEKTAHFLSILFPSDQLNILDYNRVVFDLNGHSLDEFLVLVSTQFELTLVSPENAPYRPKKRGEFGMYVKGSWYRLMLLEGTRPDDAIAGLDVSLLQDRLLDPILGIDDPRSSKRIAYIGGVRGLKELERRADKSGGASFAVYPCSLEELFAVADTGELMPPKSTWFEPKPRSGLFLHKI